MGNKLIIAIFVSFILFILFTIAIPLSNMRKAINLSESGATIGMAVSALVFMGSSLAAASSASDDINA
jgi:hypothetical protein